MRYFFDTEFVEDGETIMPISIGIIEETGRELYLEFQFDDAKAEAHDFVRENVLPHLRGQERYTREQARDRIVDFVGIKKQGMALPRKRSRSERPEFWAYYADYDWVLLCQVFGTMMDLPAGFPKFCMDLQQWWVMGGCKVQKPEKPKNAHDALADARWNFEFYKALAANEMLLQD
jgi:hypothetical protein